VKAPEITYRFQYPRDVAGPTFEVLHRVQNADASSTSVALQLSIIPKDKILVLSNISIQAIPGATQACEDIRFSAFTPAALEFNISRFVAAGTADTSVAFNWQGEVYIHGRADNANNVQAAAIFDAGANSNGIRVTFSGIVIPRGNAALF